MPKPRTVNGWTETNTSFREKFDAAMSVHADWCKDEEVRLANDSTGDSKIVDGKLVVDDARVQRHRLQIDVYKHRSAVLKPAKYASLARLEHSGRDGDPIKSESSELEVARRLAFILAGGAEAADLQKNPRCWSTSQIRLRSPSGSRLFSRDPRPAYLIRPSADM